MKFLFQTILVNDNFRVVTNTVMRVLLNALACNQSIDVLKAMFSTERSIVRKVMDEVFYMKAFLPKVSMEYSMK